jgi:hypothetical protein
MKSSKIFVTVVTMILFYSCSKPEMKTLDKNNNYPDIPAFFKAEAERLSIKKGLKVQKSTVLNDKKESKISNIKDWNAEFSMFFRYKIHESAQRPYYKVTEEGNKVLFETSVDAMQLKKITVVYSDKTSRKIKSLEMEIIQNNEVYGSKMTVNYDIEKGYSINKKQKVILFTEDIFEIKLNFLDI